MDISKLFPRDPYGRIALIVAGALFIPMFGMATYAFLFQAHPRGIVEWACYKVAGELFAVATLFFTCGLVWALATPRWMENLLEAVAGKFMIALALIVFPFCVMAIWALIFG